MNRYDGGEQPASADEGLWWLHRLRWLQFLVGLKTPKRFRYPARLKHNVAGCNVLSCTFRASLP